MESISKLSSQNKSKLKFEDITLPKDAVRAIQDVLLSVDYIIAAGIFGSRADKSLEVSTDSDIDICIAVKPINTSIYRDVKFELIRRFEKERNINNEIDITFINRVESKEFIETVREQVIILKGDKDKI